MQNIKNSLLSALLILAATVNLSFAMDDEPSTALRRLTLKATQSEKESEIDDYSNSSEFSLSHQKFTRKDDPIDAWNFICRTFPANTYLKKFCLNKCILGKLPVQGWEIFATALQSCENLTSLDLSYNKTKGNQKNLLIPFIESLSHTRLKHINLSHRTLKHYQCDNPHHEGCRFKEILINLSRCQFLEELDLSHNCLDLNHIGLIFRTIPFFKNLKSLNLSCNTLKIKEKKTGIDELTEDLTESTISPLIIILNQIEDTAKSMYLLCKTQLISYRACIGSQSNWL